MRKRNLAWVRALPFVALVLLVAMVMAGPYAYTKTDAGTSSATVDFYYKVGARIAVTAISAKSDQADQLVFYEAKDNRLYHPVATANAGQKEIVIVGADTIPLEAAAVIFVQDDDGLFFYFDSIDSRTDSTITLINNLPDTTYATDIIRLMEVGWRLGLKVDTSRVLSGSPLFYAPVNSPLHIYMGGSSACTLEYATVHYE